METLQNTSERKHSAHFEIKKEDLNSLLSLEVDIQANFDEVLKELESTIGVDLESRHDEYHITVIAVNEHEALKKLNPEILAELERIHTDIQLGKGVTISGIGFIDGSSDEYRVRERDKRKKVAFLALEIPALQLFRSKIGLPPKDFHITLGFHEGDIHMRVVEQVPVKPNSTKFKDVIEPIPKRANSRFQHFPLPEIQYGGIQAKMKIQK